jgi:hypothetical protein
MTKTRIGHSYGVVSLVSLCATVAFSLVLGLACTTITQADPIVDYPTGAPSGTAVYRLAPAANGCPYLGETLIGATTFKYTALVKNNNESILPTYWNLIDFPATSCRSIDLTFGMPADGSQPGDTASVQITAQTLVPQSARVGYGAVAHSRKHIVDLSLCVVAASTSFTW